MSHYQGERRSKWNGDQLKALIDGALTSSINSHGPITHDNLGSAVKRIASQIRGYGLERLTVESAGTFLVPDLSDDSERYERVGRGWHRRWRLIAPSSDEGSA